MEQQMELSEVLWIALIGFLFVAALLFALVLIIRIFGLIFTQQAKMVAKRDQAEGKDVVKKQMVSPEEIAAIAVALRLHTLELHDRESTILTIQSIRKAYSPWSAKVHMLRELPQREIKSNKIKA